MQDKKQERKCIIKEKGCKSYSTGLATYESNLYRAKIYNESEIPDYIKRDPEEEIIFLDTKEGLDLLVKEFETIQGQIDLYEGRVNEMKRGLDRLFKTNPNKINRYIEEHNKRHYKISNEEKDEILERIINENK